MTEAPVIREAADTDLDAVAAFFWEGWRQAGPDAPGWSGATEDVMAELTDPETLRAQIGGPGRRMFLAWEDGRVIAFAATRMMTPAVVEVAGIVVLQYALGRGVGSPLLETAVAASREAGFEQMVVRTEADNDRAAGFYRSRGFTDDGAVTEVVEGIELDVLQFSRDLTFEPG